VVVGYLLLIGLGRRGIIGEKLYDWFGFSFAFSWRPPPAPAGWRAPSAETRSPPTPAPRRAS
jgi:hypothetical protein